MEDVQFLKHSARQDSYLFLVDSEKRNKAAYPSPSQYTIQFNGPFKNVIGLELLDATIPRTEYVIDEDCNTLVYSIDGGGRKKATIVPGDYNLLQLCEALTKVLEGGLAAEPVSTPYSQTSKLRFTCSVPFTIFLSESSMRRQVGFAGIEKSITSGVADGATVSRSFMGPYPGFDVFRVGPGVVLRQPFSPTVAGYVKSVTMYLDTDTSDSVDIRIVDESDVVYGTTTVSASGTPQMDFENTSMPLQVGETYYIVIESDNGADVYVNTPTNASAPAETAATASAQEWDPLENSVTCEIWVGVDRHELESTDLVDLTGVRYVTVRCPEIETYLYRERAYEPFYAGLGMVKLGRNGMREQRFDFVSFPPRTLTTPLGKLSSLSFRLEKPDGTLYNSRGIDHSLLLVLKYYSGINADTTPEQQRILNPNYVPQSLQFLENTTWRQEVDARDTLDTWPRR